MRAAGGDRSRRTYPSVSDEFDLLIRGVEHISAINLLYGSDGINVQILDRKVMKEVLRRERTDLQAEERLLDACTLDKPKCSLRFRPVGTKTFCRSGN
jgi:hypothetical protein